MFARRDSYAVARQYLVRTEPISRRQTIDVFSERDSEQM